MLCNPTNQSSAEDLHLNQAALGGHLWPWHPKTIIGVSEVTVRVMLPSPKALRSAFAQPRSYRGALLLPLAFF